MFSALPDESSPEYFIKNVAFKTVPVEKTKTAETLKKSKRIVENQNRLRNIKNHKIDKKNKLWGEFKKATRTQTGKNSGQKQGGDAAEAQSVKPEVAPVETVEAKEVSEASEVSASTIRTKVPFRLKKQEASRWLARRAMGVSENLLEQELRAFQLQRTRHEMLVSMTLEALDTGKTRTVKGLLDTGCTATCIDRDYAKAENFEMKELESPIMARNADGTENTKGRITHYVELIVTIGPHSERRKFLVTGLGKARIFIGYDWFFEHNPTINWRDQKILFNHCPPECGMDNEEFCASTNSTKFMEDGESLLVVDFAHAIELRAKSTHAQQLAEEANVDREKMTADKIPEQYRDYVKVFAKESFDTLPEKRPWDHAIELKPDAKAVDCKIYPLSLDEQKKLDEFLDENLKTGRIRPSKSPMASAFFFVKKKDGSLRPVQDYRKLNEMTIKNRYPLPLISELVNKLRGASYFTKLDIRWGYNNVRIKEGDEWKAAFRTNRGLYEPLVMFFGLTNSPATFQTMMNDILRELVNEGHVIIYLDDILIFTETLEEHHRIVARVLETLEKHNLYLKPEKCDFDKKEIEYLGVIISHNSMRMDPVKIAGIMEWPEPKNVKQVQAFLGFVNFYRRFIRGFSDVAKPLTKLTGKAGWTWGDDQRNAFAELKRRVAEDVVLALPTDDGKFRLEADASEGATGAVLSQEQDGKWRPVAFMSHGLNETERNYEIYDKEMLAIMLALEEWRPMLLGARHEFEILTDHQNLEYFKKPQKINRRQARWITELAPYYFTLKHRAGALNKKADLLSRRADHDMGKDDNRDVVLLKPEYFRAEYIRAQGIELEGPEKEIWDKILETKRIDKSVKNALEQKLPGWEKKDGIIYYNGLIYVPWDKELRDKIIGLHHDSPLLGHPGENRTQE